MTIHAFNQVVQKIGYTQKTQKEEWISQPTWKAIEDRKQIKKGMLDAKSPRLKQNISREYADKQVKNKARNEKRPFMRRGH